MISALTYLGMIASPVAYWLILALVVVLFVLWLFFRKRGPEETPQATEPPAPTEVAVQAEDDLKVIEGIGPKLEQVLKGAGIKTFRDLAERSVEELQAILDAAGIARISDPGTWPEQARLAAEGRWDELKALQDSLKGGRRVD